MDTKDIADMATVGLSPKNHEALRRLKEDGHFNEMVDAYRLAIALALGTGAVPPTDDGPRTTIFNTATLDPRQEIAAAIRAIGLPEGTTVYRHAERLAEWGVAELSRRAQTGRIDVAAMVRESEKHSGGRL